MEHSYRKAPIRSFLLTRKFSCVNCTLVDFRRIYRPRYLFFSLFSTFPRTIEVVQIIECYFSMVYSFFILFLLLWTDFSTTLFSSWRIFFWGKNPLSLYKLHKLARIFFDFIPAINSADLSSISLGSMPAAMVSAVKAPAEAPATALNQHHPFYSS